MLYSLEDLMQVLLIAVSFAGIMGGILLIVFRKNGKYEIPFVPFLFLGWLVSQGLNVVGGVLG